MKNTVKENDTTKEQKPTGADPAALEEEARRSFDSLSIPDHLRTYLDQGLPEKEAMKKVAADRGISRRDVYRAIHVENRE